MAEAMKGTLPKARSVFGKFFDITFISLFITAGWAAFTLGWIDNDSSLFIKISLWLAFIVGWGVLEYFAVFFVIKNEVQKLARLCAATVSSCLLTILLAFIFINFVADFMVYLIPFKVIAYPISFIIFLSVWAPLEYFLVTSKIVKEAKFVTPNSNQPYKTDWRTSAGHSGVPGNIYYTHRSRY